MARYNSVKSLNIAHVAYIAGVIDGEGTITLTRKAKDKPRQLVVTVSSCEYQLLSFLLRTIGAGLITSKRTYKKNHSEAFTFRLVNRQALELLRQVSPYLRTYKKERARLVLKYYLRVTPRNGKYSFKQLLMKRKFEDSFFRILANTKNR